MLFLLAAVFLNVLVATELSLNSHTAVCLTAFVSMRYRTQDGCSLHIENRFPRCCFLSPSLFSFSSFFSCFSLLWCWSDLNCFLVKQWLHPFLPFFLTLDLWQRVRAAAATACRPPSWCRCPPHLSLRLWLWLQLAPAPRSQTANQESCLPTWRRWRYQDTHLAQ